MIKKIKDNIWQISFTEFGSCVYVLKIRAQIILIDTGSELNRGELKEELKKLKINLKDVNIIILTHYHFDHLGNIDLFPNAKIYGSKEDFNSCNIENIDNLNLKEFRIIKTPGHSKESICILYDDVLFSGDTLFYNGGVGRVDLPGGSEKDLQASLQKLQRINYKTLCPGHI